MTAIDVLNGSLRMDRLPIGGSGVDLESIKKDWRGDIEKCIENRREVFIVP